MRSWRQHAGGLVSEAPSPANYPELPGLLPPERRHLAHEQGFIERLRACVHPEFYAAQLAEARSAQLGDSPDVEVALRHYLRVGVHEGARVGALFNSDWYAERLHEAGGGVPQGQDPFFHWLTIGWERRVVPTPLFDERTYLENHPQLRLHPRWVFHHYLVRGCYQQQWTPSPAGQHHAGGKSEHAHARQSPLMLPELLHRADQFDLRYTSWLEEGVRAVLAKRQRVESGTMRRMVDRAGDLEPLIHRPRRDCVPTTWPLHRHPRLRVSHEVGAARAAVGEERVDTIILLPHCRIGGAARVAGLFAHALAASAGSGRVLIVTTDLPAFERPDWFPPQIPVIDLCPRLVGMNLALRSAVLFEFVRGLNPARIVNINSSLGWNMLLTFGPHLATHVELGAYLFTWDVDDNGHKGGYPILYFQRCFEHLSWVLFDSDRLRRELIGRYVMPSEAQRRMVLARTPVAESEVDVTGGFERRRSEGAPLRAFWAGRFDRQKRFDLMVAIARELPDLEVLVWGKPVLHDLPVDLQDLPPNIRLMGTYEEFDDIPLRELDFMLYTAAWDGIPTVLLDAAQRGIPVVASAVGGVPEVVSHATGYPVVDADDPAAYVGAIKEMVEDPWAATERTRHMRELVRLRFHQAGYHRVIASLLGESEGEP